MSQETRESLEALIAQVAPTGSRLRVLLDDYLGLSSAMGEAATALAAIRIREVVTALRAPSAERQKLNRQLAALNHQVIKNAIPFSEAAHLIEGELEGLRDIARQNAQTAREEQAALEFKREVEREAERMTLGGVISKYSSQLALNAQGELTTTRGAQLTDRDRIIVGLWREEIISFLREGKEEILI